MDEIPAEFIQVVHGEMRKKFVKLCKNIYDEGQETFLKVFCFRWRRKRMRLGVKTSEQSV